MRTENSYTQKYMLRNEFLKDAYDLIYSQESF